MSLIVTSKNKIKKYWHSRTSTAIIIIGGEQMENQKKVRFELKITEDEKRMLKASAAQNGKPVNKYVIDLVKEDNKKKEK